MRAAISPRPVLLTALAAAASGAAADWPNDPATPLVVGQAQWSITERQSVIATDDGAAWVAWQDSFCGGFDDGAVRLQRISTDGQPLTPLGIAAADDTTCGFMQPPVLVRVGDGAMVSRALAGLELEPIGAFDATGATSWDKPFTGPAGRYLGAAAPLVGGDVLVVSALGTSIYADRLDPAGDPVWAQTTQFASDTGSNLDVFGLVPIAQGGAYVFWDSSSFPYTRLIRAQRVNADGSVAWPTSVRFVESPPGVTSSRHTVPDVVPDGQGGAVVFFARGFETGTTPAPLLMQRVDADGDLFFPLSGHRVSLGSDRQFDPIAMLDEATGELIVVWRDGLLSGQSVRAQRITVDGTRLWGDEGVHVATVTPDDDFDAAWDQGRLSVATVGAAGVTLHVLDGAGDAAHAPVVVGVGPPASSVAIAPVAGGIVVTWQADLEGDDDLIVAQRVNAGGRLGDPGCNAADLAEPVGQLDFSDVVAFLTAFSGSAPQADLAEPFGQWDFSDVVAFLTAFAAGCP